MPETFDFGKGLVACRRHNFGNGLVANTAQAGGTVSVGFDSTIGEEGRVHGNVSLLQNTVVRGNARIEGKSCVRLQNCLVEGDSVIEGEINLTGVTVKGKVVVRGNVFISGPVVIGGDTVIEDLSLFYHAGKKLVVDRTPVVIRGLTEKPIILIWSPRTALLLADRIYYPFAPDMNLRQELTEMGIDIKEATLILNLVADILVLKTGTVGEYRSDKLAVPGLRR